MSHRSSLAGLGLLVLLLVAIPAAAGPSDPVGTSGTPVAAGAAPAPAPVAGPAPLGTVEASPTVRTAVSGQPPPAPPSSTTELETLRRFEESAFPRPVPAPISDAEGEPPPVSPPRPSAETPPPELRSQSHHQAAPPPSGTAPEPWLAQLILPDLPIRWDPKLIRYLEFYRSSAKGRAIMNVWLKRLGRYRKLIGDGLRRHGLPQALIFVAMIESGFNPKVTSFRGAAGIWQFMPYPGEGYGLRRDHWVDERRNPERSTEAAIRFLKDLHQRFGTWELALAAYNAGYGGVTRAIQKYNTNDYWQLCRYEAGLPWDTTLYVPKILAAAIVGQNRAFFGYEEATPDPEIAHVLVSVPTSITLAQAAAAAGVSRETMEMLNPELRRGRTPPTDKAWLRVPPGSEERFYAALARMKGQLARYMPYVVRLGDTETELARSYGLSRGSLRQINGLDGGDDLRPGLTILVPARGKKVEETGTAKNDESAAEEERLLVPLPAESPTTLPGRKRVFYRVTAGDSLAEIARHLRVTLAELLRWNALDERAKLLTGMVLLAFVPQDFDERSVVLLDPARLQLVVAGSERFLSSYEERKGRRRITYTVREGDTLTALSRRFGLSVGSLMRINRFGRKTQLRAGQTVVVYVEAAKLPRQKRPSPPEPVAPPATPASQPATSKGDDSGGEEAQADPEPERRKTAAEKKAPAAPEQAESPRRRKTAVEKKAPAAPEQAARTKLKRRVREVR